MKQFITSNWKLILSFLLFAASFIIEHFYGDLAWYYSFSPAIVGYVLISYKIYWNYILEVKEGSIFNEFILMIIATIASFCIVFFPPHEHEFSEALAIMVFYSIGEELNEYSYHKSETILSKILNNTPKTIKKLNGGKIVTCPLESININDHILYNPGELITIDGIICKGKSMLNMSGITGESIPKEVNIKDSILSGAINVLNPIEIIANTTYQNSLLYKINKIVSTALNEKSKRENIVTRLTKWYTPIVFLLAIILCAVVPLCVDYNNLAIWLIWIQNAIILLIISCPCAIILSIPLSYFCSFAVCGKNAILIKNANALENLAITKVLCFDKTGTLTNGLFKINEIEILDKNYSKDEVIKIAATIEQFSTHPIAKSFLAINQQKISTSSVKQVKEIKGQGLTGLYNGKKIIIGSCQLLQNNKINFTSCECNLTHTYLALNNKVIAFFGIGDQIKEQAVEALTLIKKQHVQRIVVLSGDKNKAVSYIASQLHISEFKSELLPTDKVNEIMHLISTVSNCKVAFIGDGYNDSPSLIKADVGIAMGKCGSDLAIDAANVVILDDNLMKVPFALKVAKYTRKIILFNILFSITIKLIVGCISIVSSIYALSILDDLIIWLAIFADVGVTLIAIFTSFTILSKKGYDNKQQNNVINQNLSINNIS